jgi:iron complex outermembrane receptor protein
LNYQFVGTEAELYGFEFSAEVELTQFFVADISTSYTIGRQDTVDITGSNPGTRPLPQIPPFKAKTSIKYVNEGLELGSRIQFAAEQNRTGEFETPTGSYFLTDIFAQYRFNTKKLLHTISFNMNNLLNKEYYNHLSRIKDLRPEPGRNITLLYRIYF